MIITSIMTSSKIKSLEWNFYYVRNFQKKFFFLVLTIPIVHVGDPSDLQEEISTKNFKYKNKFVNILIPKSSFNQKSLNFSFIWNYQWVTNRRKTSWSFQLLWFLVWHISIWKHFYLLEEVIAPTWNDSLWSNRW